MGRPRVGKTHLALGPGLKAVQAGHAVLFDAATGWITRLRDAHDEGRLAAELKRLRRCPVPICDEVGYIRSCRGNTPRGRHPVSDPGRRPKLR